MRMVRVLVWLAALAAGVYVLTRVVTGGDSELAGTPQWTQSDFQDLSALNDADLGGFQAGTRAFLVEDNTGNYEIGDGGVGL